MTQVDITKIDRDFLGVSGLLSEFVNIVGHASYHPFAICRDGIWMSTSVCQGCAPPSEAIQPMTFWMSEICPPKVHVASNDMKVAELSGGKQQKVVIAKSLVQDPDLVIFR